MKDKKQLTELLNPDINREFWDDINSELGHLIGSGQESHEEFFTAYKGYGNEDLAGVIIDFPYSLVMKLKEYDFDLTGVLTPQPEASEVKNKSVWVQTLNPRTGRYVKIDTTRGMLISKKTKNPYKHIRIIK